MSIQLLSSIGFLCLSLFVYSQDSLLTEIVKKQAYQLHLKDGKLSGPGQEFLNQIGKETSFF